MIRGPSQKYPWKYVWLLGRCPLHNASAWDFQQCGMCNQQRLRPACAYAQSDQSLCLLLEYSMTVKLLTQHIFEFLNLKGGCTGLSESTPVKMPHCWKSHVAAHIWQLQNVETVFCYVVLLTSAWNFDWNISDVWILVNCSILRRG